MKLPAPRWSFEIPIRDSIPRSARRGVWIDLQSNGWLIVLNFMPLSPPVLPRTSRFMRYPEIAMV
jgi:hypothetical protein